MASLQINTLGRPRHEQRKHRLRWVGSLAAAIAGGLALMGFAMAFVGGALSTTSPIAWLALIALLAVWLSGIWWRWDSPDVRDPHKERERRGF